MSGAEMNMQARPASTAHRLDALLRPRSIAIVGASGREDSFGKQLQRSIGSLGYEGQIYLINPKYPLTSTL